MSRKKLNRSEWQKIRLKYLEKRRAQGTDLELQRKAWVVSFQRIASLGAGSLPEDLADQHDYYGHGGPKK